MQIDENTPIGTIVKNLGDGATRILNGYFFPDGCGTCCQGVSLCLETAAGLRGKKDIVPQIINDLKTLQ